MAPTRRNRNRKDGHRHEWIGGYACRLPITSGCSAEADPGTSSRERVELRGDIRNITGRLCGLLDKLYSGPKGGLRWGSNTRTDQRVDGPVQAEYNRRPSTTCSNLFCRYYMP